MIYIGIDPGKDGAMAVITPDTKIVIPFDPSGYRNALEWLQGFAKNCRCCLESVGAMPGQGVTSMFRFGENFGFIQGLLTVYSIPYELVTPQKWKKEFQVTGDKTVQSPFASGCFPAHPCDERAGAKKTMMGWQRRC